MLCEYFASPIARPGPILPTLGALFFHPSLSPWRAARLYLALVAWLAMHGRLWGTARCTTFTSRTPWRISVLSTVHSRREQHLVVVFNGWVSCKRLSIWHALTAPRHVQDNGLGILAGNVTPFNRCDIRHG